MSIKASEIINLCKENVKIECPAKKEEKNKAETNGCKPASSQVATQDGQQNNNCCISGLKESATSVETDGIKELLKSVEVNSCNCCNNDQTTYMKKFVEESIKSLKASGKELIKEIEKVLLSDSENIIEDVKLLKEYTHQVLWFLLSYVAVEEYILVCNWLCKLKEYLCEIIKCVKKQDSTQSTQCCEHLNDTQNKENCICRILCNIICLLIKFIKRLHTHKREIILRKDTTTPADSKCTCSCTKADGNCKRCTCVKKDSIGVISEGFTVSTKSLDNIRSTILIFYGMEKIIKKYEKLGCKNGKCACKDMSGEYTECLSLFSVCYNILVDLSSMKDGTLPAAVMWLSNCLKFIDKVEAKKCDVKTLDTNYHTRTTNYECLSNINVCCVTELANNYKGMIGAANGLNGVKGEEAVKNNVANCNGLQSCNTTSEASSTECNCNDKSCECSPTADPNESVFKDLCKMMCCNQENGSNCGCSSTSGKNCNSISTFCKEVDKFMKLVKEVKKNGAPAQESTSTPTPPTCECKEKNCEYCKTCRFIRLVEEYTKELNGNKECECKDFVDKIFGQFSIIIKTPFRLFGIDWACPCCKYNYENCLKDINSHCGISKIMKDWFCCDGCKCIGVGTAKRAKRQDENSENSNHTDKLCKCLVEVFKKVAQALGICKNGDNQKCPCSCSCASDSTSNSCSCLKQCCESDTCKCTCKKEASSGSTTLPLHTLHTAHRHSRITVITLIPHTLIVLIKNFQHYIVLQYTFTHKTNCIYKLLI